MFGRHRIEFPARAKILADEGYGMVDKSQTHTLQHQKYIIEVHPDAGEPFRAEARVWVSWPGQPQVGDVVNVSYDPKSRKTKIELEGDPRFDWRLQRAQAAERAARQRDELLRGQPSSDPLQ
jgi:hypothetical protein